MSVPSRGRLLWPALGMAVAIPAAAAAVVMTRSMPARPRPDCCRRPPYLSAVNEVPRLWRTAVAHGDAPAAWRLLTPEARRRYGSVSGLREHLADLTPRPREPATWRLVDQTTQGFGTPGEFVYMLIETRALRPLGAVVVHSMADGTQDGRVDPGASATIEILEPAPDATVAGRPRIRAATSSPSEYVAVRAGGQTIGAVGTIRGPDGFDTPFDEALRAGRTLIVALSFDRTAHLTYGSVRVTVR